MELKTDSMQNMKKVVEKCLDELMKKNDLTPAETKAALDGFKLYDELCCRIEDCKNEEKYNEQGYSGSDVPYRQYHITSYGMPERAVYHDRSYGYSGGPQYGVHGWYESSGYPGYPHEHMNGSYCGDPRYSERRGYSRHSISDRVVSMVEQMMDTAQSDYERQELQKYIRAIRAMGMTD